MLKERAICHDSRDCFAKMKFPGYSKHNACSILEEGFPNGKCKFCKPSQLVTNGVYYPVKSPKNKERYCYE